MVFALHVRKSSSPSAKLNLKNKPYGAYFDVSGLVTQRIEPGSYLIMRAVAKVPVE